MNFKQLNTFELESFLDNTDLSNCFDNINELEEFLVNTAPSEYIKSYMCQLSVLNLIEKFLVEDQKEKEQLLEIESLSNYAGLSYPDQTCPMIDSEISSLKSDKNDLEIERNSLEEEISEIEKILEDPSCYNNEEIEDKQNRIEDINSELDKIIDDLENAEVLRNSCENVREAIVEYNKNIKDDIQLYLIDCNGLKFHLMDLPEYTEDDIIDSMNNVFNEPDFNNADLDNAIKNLQEIYKMGKEMGEYIESQFKNDILRFSHTYDRNDFVQDFLKKILTSKKE